MQIFCDFDGTISVGDTTDLMLSRFADPQWEQLEAQWKAGRIGSGECMRQQIALIRADKADLDAALDTVTIDPHFPAFVAFCRSEGIPVSILSDGVDYFIRRILQRHGICDLPITANRLTVTADAAGTHYRLDAPFADAACVSGAGVCKCVAVEAARSSPRIYVGDGRSDFCVSDLPETVFAKDALARFCTEAGTPFLPYLTFADVTAALRRSMRAANAVERLYSVSSCA